MLQCNSLERPNVCVPNAKRTHARSMTHSSFVLWRIGWTLLLWVILTSTLTEAVPLGFVDEGVTTYPFVMSAIMVPNLKPSANGKPMMIITRKDGMIDVLEDPDNSQVWMNILDMTAFVCENGPRGIQTVVAHPKFSPDFPYIYVYYTRIIKDCPTNAITGPSNRLSRFTLDQNSLTINMSSEKVLVETPPSVNTIHDGGGLFIGNDNNIYLGTGDGGDPDNSQNLRSLWGKLIRVTLDDTTPSDNPYSTKGTGTGVPCRNNRGVPPKNAPSDAVCEEIYAYGLRSPFRFSEDINTKDEVRFNLCDVGGKVWEEVTLGGTQYKGLNYGWPEIEGPCSRWSVDNCPVPTGNGADPFYWYEHDLSIGAAVVGALHVPNKLWPDEYKTILVEHSEGKLYNLIEDDSKACRTCKPPRPSYRTDIFHSFPRIVDSFFGPYKNTQALYYVSREKTLFNVRRIYYTGSDNSVPKAKITGLNGDYEVNNLVTFMGDESSDGDNDRLSFFWEFGDGTTSKSMNPTHRYRKRGAFEVTLTVTDTRKQSSQDTATVIVGVRPDAKIELPLEGTLFKVGDVLRLKGSAIDLVTNEPIDDPSRFTWEVRQHHENHYHPFLDLREGNNFNLFPAPAPEDFYAATNSYLRILMTVYDSDGVFRQVSRIINPYKVTVKVLSVPGKLDILLDGIRVTTPAKVTAWHSQVIAFDAPDQGNKVFSRWNIKGNSKVNYKVKPDRNVTAYFDKV